MFIPLMFVLLPVLAMSDEVNMCTQHMRCGWEMEPMNNIKSKIYCVRSPCYCPEGMHCLLSNYDSLGAKNEYVCQTENISIRKMVFGQNRTIIVILPNSREWYFDCPNQTPGE